MATFPEQVTFWALFLGVYVDGGKKFNRNNSANQKAS
jgi:hypothetical protein